MIVAPRRQIIAAVAAMVLGAALIGVVGIGVYGARGILASGISPSWGSAPTPLRG